jgi:hypothetical protein
MGSRRAGPNGRVGRCRRHWRSRRLPADVLPELDDAPPGRTATRATTQRTKLILLGAPIRERRSVGYRLACSGAPCHVSAVLRTTARGRQRVGSASIAVAPGSSTHADRGLERRGPSPAGTFQAPADGANGLVCGRRRHRSAQDRTCRVQRARVTPRGGLARAGRGGKRPRHMSSGAFGVVRPVSRLRRRPRGLGSVRPWVRLSS